MSLFALSPRIRKNSGRIIATTAWRVRLVFLGTLYRSVAIDPQKRKLTIASRYFWFIVRRRQINFSRIVAVTYGYEDMSAGSALSTSHASLDWFTVGLRLADDTELKLFNFIGQGSYINESSLPDWLRWKEYAFDFSGSQEQESRAFVKLLAKMCDVTVVPPR